MAEPLPIRVAPSRPLEARGDMAAAAKAAETARMGTEHARTRELRQVCMAYAMKLAEKREDPSDAASIIADAERFYAFFSEPKES